MNYIIDVCRHFEDMFEGLGLFKHPPTTYNNEVLNSLLNISLHMFPREGAPFIIHISIRECTKGVMI
jgi:hypothetical protein